MLKIRTVCGNGIGSSLMAANHVKNICATLNIKADVASIDFANAEGEKADLYVTIKDLAKQFSDNQKLSLFVVMSIKSKLRKTLVKNYSN